MTFVKVVKSKSYFKRFQVKFRRRRQGKTDYKARQALVVQYKNKYNAKKHRLVVRITNKRIICQVVYTTLQGDRVLCAAESSELPRYGIPVGLSNYAAAYATGLLLARRLLKQLGLEEQFNGDEEVTGEYKGSEDGERRPFKCILDLGIVRATTGNRVFGAMKGACDGGLYVPHSTKRFFGYSVVDKEGTYDAEAHRARIFGSHVAAYMSQLKEEDYDKYKAQFGVYIQNNIEAGSIEKLYADAHKKIREDPQRKVAEKSAAEPVVREGNVIKTKHGSYIRMKKLSADERKERVMKKVKLIQEKLLGGADEE